MWKPKRKHVFPTTLDALRALTPHAICMHHLLPRPLPSFPAPNQLGMLPTSTYQTYHFYCLAADRKASNLVLSHKKAYQYTKLDTSTERIVRADYSL
jgi:hypothetical protein